MSTEKLTRGLMLLLVMGWVQTAPAQSIDSVRLADDTEIVFQRYQADGNRVLVWWPSEHGLSEGLGTVASRLSVAGVEVLIVDPFTTWFLPTLRSSLAEIPRQQCGSFLRAVQKETNKRLFVASQGRGAKLLLECLRSGRLQGLGNVAGVVLISPNLFTRRPQPGKARDFEPIATATNFPVFVVFTEKSVEQLYRHEIVAALTSGGSRVYHTVVEDVRNRYYYRPDAVTIEQRAADDLPRIILQSIVLLARDTQPRGFASLDEVPQLATSFPTRKLVRYEAPQQRSLHLPGIDGRIHDSADYRGQVLLVSFWASWCPPCVHELPSMVRLQALMAEQPFRVLAVNLDEDLATIDQFLRHRPVNFPVLLDAGLQHARHWQVSVFPSSFVLDGNGIIRYAVAGALEWDDPSIVDTIRDLIAK